jgi:hypothetical protein
MTAAAVVINSGECMGLLQEEGVDRVHHYAPLHYLPFIARDRALRTKPSLAAKGFGPSHLRSKSSRHDIARGFGKYAFLTLERHPKILEAKLNGGFPHVDVIVPVEAFDSTIFDLCRFNVAMTRQLRRLGKSGFPESDTNGRYYEPHQIPVARVDNDKRAMLRKHYDQTMIELLMHHDLALSDDTRIQVYSEEDEALAKNVLASAQLCWNVELVDPPGAYPRSPAHAQAIDEFIQKALDDPNWRGNGLEFDKV